MCSVDDLGEVKEIICVYGKVLKFRLDAQMTNME